MRWRTLKHKKTKPTTPNKQLIHYARLSNKIKAFITDMFMIYMPILYLITYVFMNGKDDFQNSIFGPLSGVLLYALIDSLFTYKTGQTPGKKAYDIQVVHSKTLKKISFFRALWRFSLFIISASTIFALLVPFFRKDRQSLHDLLSHTTLISLEK